MADPATPLASRAPAHGLLPVRHGGLTLEEVPMGPVTGVAPLRGCDLSLPAPGTWRDEGERRTIWAGLDQWLVAGPAPDAPGAAVTDQSDAWCRVRLSGPGVDDVLARLTPLDPAALTDGTCARSLVGHMNALLLRDGAAVEIWAMRSMAGSLVHEVERAMRGVAARWTLEGDDPT